MSRINHALANHEVYHGGIDLRELARYGIDPNRVIDFSSNILPDGPSPKVIAAIASAAIDRYPDRESDDLRSAISAHYGVDRDRLLIGNGCSELIHLAATAILKPGDKGLVIGPTFAEYARATRLAGATVQTCDSTGGNRFAIPFFQIEDQLKQQCFNLVWICNPNNPTAQVIPAKRLATWFESYPKTCFVVDESYIEFSETAESMLSYPHPNLIVLRSMTKAYAIPGVRLGFAALANPLHEKLCGRRVPWNVSSLAQAAGIAALGDSKFYQAALSRAHDLKAELVAELVTAGYEIIPGDANFFLLRTERSQAHRERLLRQGIIVRDCISFGLDDCIRIAARDRTSNWRLVDAIIERVPRTGSRAPQSDVKVSTSFDERFRHQLQELFRKRRDVRRFRTDPIAEGAVERWIEAACLAPSVGLSQPWRFVSVTTQSTRNAVYHEFELQNEVAAEGFKDASISTKYRSLKLAGLKEAPEHLAVFVEPEPAQGRGLGRSTMPQSTAYSVVAAIQNFWLAARAEGVGVGWVSILRPEQIGKLLDVPESWRLVAYLCIGWPQVGDDEVPELEQVGWEKRVAKESLWTER